MLLLRPSGVERVVRVVRPSEAERVLLRPSEAVRVLRVLRPREAEQVLLILPPRQRGSPSVSPSRRGAGTVTACQESTSCQGSCQG